LALDADLWTEEAKLNFYGGDAAAYQAAILEQYKTYVEMADRISERRATTNTFFLTLNTAIFTGVGVLLQSKVNCQPWWLVAMLTMLLGECFAWFYLLRSYRLLNSAKYEVVGVLETRLPASPYWRAERKLLTAKKYWPLSHIESWIPVFFATLYCASCIALIAARSG
jgi:F0F1-type ATP synthase assembly protein I